MMMRTAICRRWRSRPSWRHWALWSLVGMLGNGIPWLSGVGMLYGQVTYTVFTPTVYPSHATTQPGQAGALITLTVRDSTLAYVIQEIARQGKIRVAFKESDSRFAQRVHVRLLTVPMLEAFTTVLSGTGLAARLAPDGKNVMVGDVTGRRDHAPRMGGEIVGRVTDSASGQGLGGASVKIAGTTLSAVTSDSGYFTLKNVPSGEQVLSIKLFGYKPTERTVTVVDSQRTTMRAVLVPVPTVLSGVVTTAAGQQRKVEVGNDITVLNADSIQRVAPVTSLTDMLETRVPGLVVQHTSGIPGAPSRLRLRGISSINMSSDPIMIVDGIRVYADQSGSGAPGDPSVNGSANTRVGGGSGIDGSSATVYAGPSALDQIDPNSIEKIEVLKGPSATAIYGSDAAAGVIVITTKKGHTGPTRWTLSLDQGRSTLPSSWPMNYYMFGHSPAWNGLSQACPIGTATLCVQDSIVAFQVLNDPRYSPLTGNAGVNRDASLTVSGGSGSMTYSITGTAATSSGYLHLPPIEVALFQAQHGFAAPDWMRTPDQYATYGATSTMSFVLGQQGGTVALTSSLFRSAQQQSSLQSDLQTLSTTYLDTAQVAGAGLFANYYERAQLQTTTFNNALTLSNWKPWAWLPLNATAGLSVQGLNNTAVLPRDYDNCIGFIGCVADTLGQFALGQGTNTTGSLTVGTTIAQQRLMSTAIGINVYTLAQSSYHAATEGLALGEMVPTRFVYENGDGPSYTQLNQATYGWYLQPTFNLNSRFFASPGFRLDGGSNSGANGSTGGALSLFPKLDLSWLAVERTPSHPLWGAVTMLRPRIAFGIAGIQPGPGQSLQLLQPGQILTQAPTGPGTPIDILNVETLGNPRLHPERDRELEGGADLQLWNQRVTLTLTGYQKMAYDAILAIPVAPSVAPVLGDAVQSEAVNIGTIRNTGYEATVVARVLDRQSIDWSLNANVSQNHNRLVSLAPGLQPIDVTQPDGSQFYLTRLVPGYPLFGLWAQPIVGFADANHNGRIDPGEVTIGNSAVFVGAQEPNYEATFSTTIGLFSDRLSINTSVDYQNGLTQAAKGVDEATFLNNAYYAPGATFAQQAAVIAYQNAGNTGATSSGIGLLSSVNTLRWRSLDITYLAPPTLAHLFHTSSLALSLQGQNLGLHTHYRGVDPNVNANTSGNQTQNNGGLIPPPRMWQLKLTVGN